MIKIQTDISKINRSKIKRVEGTTDYLIKDKENKYELEVKKYEITKSKTIEDNDFITSIKEEHLHLITYLIKRYKELSNEDLEKILAKIKDIYAS